jgi:hypothetical protein
MVKNNQDTRKLLYRKIPGTGGLRIQKLNKRIKPGERVRITEVELGKFAKDFELIQGPEKQESDKPEEKSEGRFVTVPSGSGWFDVVDTATDKKVSEKKYRQNEAEKYAEDLNAQEKEEEKEEEEE